MGLHLERSPFSVRSMGPLPLRPARRACIRTCFAAFGALMILTFVATGASAQRAVHVVTNGETLASIARRHRVSADAIAAHNHLRSDALRPGDRLRIPPRSRADVPGRRVEVRPGDTLARIARRYHVDVDDIRAANAMRSTDVQVGDSLWVPRVGHSGHELRAIVRDGNPPGDSTPPPLEAARLHEAQARAAELGLGSGTVAQHLLRSPADPRWIEAAGEFADTDGTLQLPVDDSRYLRGWGSGLDGYHLAVDLGAPEGTPVHAAERGLVAYAGSGIRGYGNIVVLVHANGWVTAYAHHLRNMVVAGQIVERGELVGLVGQTGFAQGPHLHFILVHDGRHCDPTPLIRPLLRRADGEPVTTLELVWDSIRRPSGVQCAARADRPHPHRSRRHPARRR